MNTTLREWFGPSPGDDVDLAAFFEVYVPCWIPPADRCRDLWRVLYRRLLRAHPTTPRVYLEWATERLWVMEMSGGAAVEAAGQQRFTFHGGQAA
jgi:hypothetical protein